MTPSDSAYQRTLLSKFQAPIYKNVEFYRIDQVVLECRKRAHSNGNEKF